MRINRLLLQTQKALLLRVSAIKMRSDAEFLNGGRTPRNDGKVLHRERGSVATHRCRRIVGSSHCEWFLLREHNLHSGRALRVLQEGGLCAVDGYGERVAVMMVGKVKVTEQEN